MRTPDADLQILTRSVSGVTLTAQRLETLNLQAKLMKESGTTWDRNFDYMNDVDNLIKTGRPIVDAGMHCLSIRREFIRQSFILTLGNDCLRAMSGSIAFVSKMQAEPAIPRPSMIPLLS